MALRLAIVVSGRAEDGSAWSEPTETDDISTSGALFHLNQKVTRGERLYLRAHRPDGAPIEVTAVVIRVAPAVLRHRARRGADRPSRQRIGCDFLFRGSLMNRLQPPIRILLLPGEFTLLNLSVGP